MAMKAVVMGRAVEAETGRSHGKTSRCLSQMHMPLNTQTYEMKERTLISDACKPRDNEDGTRQRQAAAGPTAPAERRACPGAPAGPGRSPPRLSIAL